MGANSYDRRDRYCIIGAGPAGLAQARAFKSAGLAYDHYERHNDVGGIWQIEHPGSPIYESARLISSKAHSSFLCYPMPKSWPDYPGHTQVREYLQAFARDFGLRDAITFSSTVTAVEPTDRAWLVTLGDGQEFRYQGVVAANGMTWEPEVPSYQGAFTGEVRHAVSYASKDEFLGRRVLVVGGGNSGCDIACDAATAAKAAFISLRRGYHVIPKHIFGRPADVFAESLPNLPMRMQQPMLQGLLRLLQGDLRQYGWPRPQHPILASHPIINSAIFGHLKAGRLIAKPDIAALEGDRVLFADGSREEIDLILYATGYRMAFPFLDRGLIKWVGSRVGNFLTVFNPDVENLFTLGFLSTNAGVFADFDRLAHLVSQYILDQSGAPAKAAMFRALADQGSPDLSGGLYMVTSPRHDGYVHHQAFRQHVEAVRRHMNWPAPESLLAPTPR